MAACVSPRILEDYTGGVSEAGESEREENEKERRETGRCVPLRVHVASIADALLKCRTNRRDP